MADPNPVAGAEDEDFETIRQESLRSFEVTLTDNQKVIVFAHFHDAGANAAGHLSFIVIDPYGRQIIDRVFSVHVWKELREIPTPGMSRKTVADAKQRLANASVAPPAKLGTGRIH